MPFPLEELVRLPNFYLVTPSWQQDRLAFYWDKTGRLELYDYHLRTGECRQVSHGEVPKSIRTGFKWSRDDRSIFFGRDRDGDEMHKLFQIEVATSQVHQVTHDPATQYHVAEPSPDDSWIAVLATTPPDRQQNLFIMRPDGSAIHQLTNFARPFDGGQWSPNGQWLSGSSSETANPKNRDIYLVRADGGGIRRVLSVRDGSKEFATDWHPDGRHLAVTSDASGVYRPGILDLETGEARWLGREDVEEYAGQFSPDGRVLAALRNQDSVLAALIYDFAAGKAIELQVPAGLASMPRFVLGGRCVVLSHQSATRRPELILYDLATHRTTTLLPAEYGSLDPLLFVEDEYVWFSSTDGLPIPALLYKPRGLRDGSRRPALVLIHGGPNSQWGRGWDPYAQFLVDRGYVLIEPNIRGSTGYGVKFRDMNIKDWGGGDLEDAGAAAQYLRQLPYVDPGRIGITGGSYGGYLTYMAVTTKPDFWKAAMARVGITDLHQLYEEDLPPLRDVLRELMGDPIADRDLWRDRSPITHAHKLRAKLLIVHGVSDPRCPVSQARIFRQRLLELGRIEGEDFEYVELTDEGHGTFDIEQRLRSYRLLEDFLSRRL